MESEDDIDNLLDELEHSLTSHQKHQPRKHGGGHTRQVSKTTDGIDDILAELEVEEDFNDGATMERSERSRSGEALSGGGALASAAGPRVKT
ncbi:hypothetical protein HK104_006542, partial [Borealophlyctis nickersoniae]